MNSRMKPNLPLSSSFPSQANIFSQQPSISLLSFSPSAPRMSSSLQVSFPLPSPDFSFFIQSESNCFPSSLQYTVSFSSNIIQRLPKFPLSSFPRFILSKPNKLFPSSHPSPLHFTDNQFSEFPLCTVPCIFSPSPNIFFFILSRANQLFPAASHLTLHHKLPGATHNLFRCASWRNTSSAISQVPPFPTSRCNACDSAFPG